MGIRAIEYRPWKGDRTNPNQRWTVIARHIFLKNVRAKAVIVLLIFGMMLAHAFPIIGAILIPHEDITDEDMVGTERIIEEEEEPEYEVIDGELNFTGDIRINGEFTVQGEVYLTGGMDLEGTVMGIGLISGWAGDLSFTGAVFAFPVVNVSGLLTLGNVSQLMPEDVPNGPPGDPPGGGLDDPQLMILALLTALENATVVTGNGSISGFGSIAGNGTVKGNYVEPEDEIEIDFGGEGYLTNGLIIIFSMLLAAIICADVIAADLADSSFVLYFSRPVRAFDYLIGKFTGLMAVMWLFCLIPPMAYVLVMMATMTGDDWSGAGKILGKTVLAGLVTAVYFLPYGLMISSITKSKAYAGIGIFMSFFVLSIISGIFRENNDKWTLIDPFELLHNMYKIMFNGSIPEGISSGEVGAAILAFTVVPMSIVVYWIYRKGVGK
jgi:ABC-type transport system involved in multi-copper enzyme maturation permease subunit